MKITTNGKPNSTKTQHNTLTHTHKHALTQIKTETKQNVICEYSLQFCPPILNAPNTCISLTCNSMSVSSKINSDPAGTIILLKGLLSLWDVPSREHELSNTLLLLGSVIVASEGLGTFMFFFKGYLISIKTQRETCKKEMKP